MKELEQAAHDLRQARAEVALAEQTAAVTDRLSNPEAYQEVLEALERARNAEYFAMKRLKDVALGTGPELNEEPSAAPGEENTDA